MSLGGNARAAILVEQRRALVVDEIKLPAHLEPGQVLVRVHYSGICGSQLGEMDGAKGPDRFLPHLLGHEGSGEVEEIGPGVRHVAPGDCVVLHWRRGAGIESLPPVYEWRGEKLNAGWVTTFNERAIVSENRLTKIAKDADMRIASLFGCAVTTGFGVVVNNAHLSIGDSVVVFGAGGVGLNMVQAASMVSADPIIALDLFDGRLELARRMGATHTINTRREDGENAIRRILDGMTLDAFIDNTGNPSVIESGYRLTGPQGRVILVGVPKVGDDVSLHSLPLHFGKRLSGSHGGETVPQTDIPRYMRLYDGGKLPLQQLLTETFTLAEINDAIARMRDGRMSGRCLIQMS